jgi:WD40 repeat protein/uncharacterized protein YecT (DUF1311 family)
MSEPEAFVHDAFISYSRKDVRFAATLDRALKRYRPPKGLPGSQRRLNVFRDQEDMVGVEYSEAISRHLRGSRKLILICSPHARRSAYVDDEVRRFAEHHPVGDIVPVLLDGVPNSRTSAPDAAHAFPESLCRLLEIPLASDYRGFDHRWRGPDHGRFRQAWYKLLADLMGCPRADVEQRERRRRRRQWLAWGGGSAVVAAIVLTVLHIADLRGRTARSNALAGRAASVTRTDPELAALLGLEAMRQADTPAAVSALRVAAAALPDAYVRVGPVSDIGSARRLSTTPDGRRLAVADGRGSARVIDLVAGGATEVAAKGASVVDVRWSPDGRWMAVIDSDGFTVVRDAATGRHVADAPGVVHWRPGSRGDGVPAVIVDAERIRAVVLEAAGRWRTIAEIPNAGGVLSPDGRLVATLKEAHRQLVVTDLDTGRSATRAWDGPVDRGLFWSPRGRYVVGHALTGFIVTDARTLATVFSKDEGNAIIVEDLSVSPDETVLAGTQRGGATVLWHISSGQEKANLFAEEGRAYHPVFSPDGSLLSVVYSNGRAALFDLTVDLGPVLATFDTIAEDEVVGTAFSLDGSRLFVQRQTGPIALFHTTRWRPTHAMPLDYDPVDALDDVSMSADGRVIGVKHGPTVRRWDTWSGRALPEADATPLQPLSTASTSSQFRRLTHEADVQSRAVSPNGTCLLTASAYRMASGGPPASADVVRLWDATSEALLQEWHFDRHGPDGAVFADDGRIVAFHGGRGLVLRTALCGAASAIGEMAGRRVARRLTADEVLAYLDGRQPAADLAATAAPDAGRPAPPPSTADSPAAPSTTAPVIPSVAAGRAGTVPPVAADPPPNAGPSFDCARAATAVERLICADAGLSALDVDLAKAYRGAAAARAGESRERLVRDQRAWIAARGRCTAAADVRACVETAFRQRLDAMR